MYLCICLSFRSGIVSLLHLDPHNWNPTTAAQSTHTKQLCVIMLRPCQPLCGSCSLFGKSRIISAQRLFGPCPLVLIRYSNSLRIGRSGDRIPIKARFFAPVQTGPWGPHSLLCSYCQVFQAVKRPGRDVDHSYPSYANVKGRVKVYLSSLSRPSWPVTRWVVSLPSEQITRDGSRGHI